MDGLQKITMGRGGTNQSSNPMGKLEESSALEVDAMDYRAMEDDTATGSYRPRCDSNSPRSSQLNIMKDNFRFCHASHPPSVESSEKSYYHAAIANLKNDGGLHETDSRNMLIVKYLPSNVGTVNMKHFFSLFGTVIEITLARGVGTVTFEESDGAEKVLAVRPIKISGETLEIHLAPKDDAGRGRRLPRREGPFPLVVSPPNFGPLHQDISPSAMSRKEKETPEKPSLGVPKGISNKVTKGTKRYIPDGTLKISSYEGFDNLGMRGGSCMRHDAPPPKRVLCSHEGCMGKARKFGLCSRHGYCSRVSCLNKAQNGKFCQMHYYGQCKHEGCTKYAQGQGLCYSHGAKVSRQKCKHEGCNKLAQRQGVCYSHGAKPLYYYCTHEGCTNIAKRKGGVCIRHGATRKRPVCNHDGCTKWQQRWGLCLSHANAAKRPPICIRAGCEYYQNRRGLCAKHYTEDRVMLSTGQSVQYSYYV